MDCRVCVVDVDAGRTRPLVAERMVAAFALAPDGRSVAYAWDRQILVSDLDRNGRRSLVRAGWGPAWSRDGRRAGLRGPAIPRGDDRARWPEPASRDPAQRQLLGSRLGAGPDRSALTR